MDKKSIKGMGELQTRTKIKNTQAIVRVLIDKEWHRYKEIKEKTKLTSPTLSAHLKELKPLLDRKTDKTRYPPLVYYKINKIFALELARILTLKITWEEIKEEFLKTKDLSSILEDINAITNEFLFDMIVGIKYNKKLREDREIIYLFLEMVVWESYRTLTWNLIDTTRKIIDDIDLNKLITKKEKLGE
jgi:hypothetical protein